MKVVLGETGNNIDGTELNKQFGVFATHKVDFPFTLMQMS